MYGQWAMDSKANLHSQRYKYYYRQQRSWGKVRFLHVSVILFTGGLPQCMLRYTHPLLEQTPQEQTIPPGSDTPWEQIPPSRGRPPPQGADTPRSSPCWEIRATSGWYTSYWNANLYYYWPQQSWVKVIFLHLSVILLTGWWWCGGGGGGGGGLQFFGGSPIFPGGR